MKAWQAQIYPCLCNTLLVHRNDAVMACLTPEAGIMGEGVVINRLFLAKDHAAAREGCPLPLRQSAEK